MEVRMPPRGLVRAFVIQWWTVGLLLLFWSVRTAQRALEAGGSHNPHVALLGAVEGAAALLFLIPRTLRIGAAGLLFTFAVAFFAHAAQREFRGDLLLYGAVVAFVAVHGAVPLSWLRSRA
jgi:uncharacterized membrane protein YphA (DoxX/SURF4 family)